MLPRFSFERPMKRLFFPLLLGIGGCAILIWLCLWQVQRLEWKEGILAEIDSRISGPAAPLDAVLSRDDPEWWLTEVSGAWQAVEPLRVLVTVEGIGPAYRLIQPFDVAGGPSLLIDRGVVPADFPIPTATGTATVTANYRTPEEVDGFTPAPEGTLWFARDAAAMAEALGTEPHLLILRTVSPEDPAVTPLPVDTSTISNDHLEYAITWALLAGVWAVMSGLLIWRTIKRRG